jgi:hypothetical protein
MVIRERRMTGFYKVNSHSVYRVYLNTADPLNDKDCGQPAFNRLSANAGNSPGVRSLRPVATKLW